MALSLDKSNIGYDSVNMQQVINKINLEAIPNTCSVIKAQASNVSSSIDAVWQGASADAFKTKLQNDTEEITKALKEIGAGITEQLHTVGSNIEAYDAAIAEMFGGSSGAGFASSAGTGFTNLLNKDKPSTTSSSNLASDVANVLNRTNATIGVFGVSVAEGILGVTESIGDACVTVAGSVGSAAIDAAGFVSGKDLSATRENWEKSIKETVEVEHVRDSFDYYYENTERGKYLAENAYAFDATRNVGNITGDYLATVTVATGVAVLTGGTLAPAIATVAMTKGIGAGAQEAFREGASLSGALGYGTVTGVIEGVQYATASNIAGMSIDIGTKIAANGAMGSTKALINPLVKSIYSDKSYAQQFKDSGGWQNVVEQGIGNAAGSAVSLGINEYIGAPTTATKTPNPSNDVLGTLKESNTDLHWNMVQQATPMVIEPRTTVPNKNLVVRTKPIGYRK